MADLEDLRSMIPIRFPQFSNELIGYHTIVVNHAYSSG